MNPYAPGAVLGCLTIGAVCLRSGLTIAEWAGIALGVGLLLGAYLGAALEAWALDTREDGTK